MAYSVPSAKNKRLDTDFADPHDASASLRLRLVTEPWVGYVPSRPLTADQFYRRYGKHDDVELINGVVVQRPMVQLEHEQTEGWLYSLFTWYLEAVDGGKIFGSRRALAINAFHVRLPDLTFVRKENLSIVEEKAIKGVPDLVFEIVSPNDRKADLLARETDYRTLGVPEIVFVYPKRQYLRVLRKTDENGGYAEEVLRTGNAWISSAMPGIVLQAEWITKEPRPSLATTLARLLPEGKTGA